MRTAALILLAVAGAAYAVGVWVRWRRLASAEPTGWAMWPGFALLSVAAALGLAEPNHGDLAWAVLGVWAAACGIHFVAGWFHRPALGLLVLPTAALAVLLALGSAAGSVGTTPAAPGHWTGRVHVALMILHLGAALLAGGAGGLWLVARRQLKVRSLRALALPPLPVLERLTERCLVVSAGLLAAGLALGGAALEAARTVSLTHPAVAIAALNLALMIVALALRAADRLGRRGLAVAALHAMALAALCAVAIQLLRHA
jgi:hypothetical protein